LVADPGETIALDASNRHVAAGDAEAASGRGGSD
jgi:hypothetical protein